MDQQRKETNNVKDFVWHFGHGLYARVEPSLFVGLKGLYSLTHVTLLSTDRNSLFNTLLLAQINKHISHILIRHRAKLYKQYVKSTLLSDSYSLNDGGNTNCQAKPFALLVPLRCWSTYGLNEWGSDANGSGAEMEPALAAFRD